ncbi:MAG: GMP synthase-like glutamine amidotransferase [Pseudohongiellaceae bacterium]|jgi:GMP synthase-like glutamine amidotransferase
MKFCIIENDMIDEVVVDRYHSYGKMFTHLFRSVKPNIEVDVFNAMKMEYPESFDRYDAVLLSGSRADAFGQDEWLVELKNRTQQLMDDKKTLIGVCFGHQLIAMNLGAEMGRAPVGWGMGRMSYRWHQDNAAAKFADSDGFSLLASHQDQVLTHPEGAEILASSEFCPIAAYTVGKHIICFQGHPEFVEDYSTCLINKRKNLLTEDQFQAFSDSLQYGHDGQKVAQVMCDFVEQL